MTRWKTPSATSVTASKPCAASSRNCLASPVNGVDLYERARRHHSWWGYDRYIVHDEIGWVVPVERLKAAYANLPNRGTSHYWFNRFGPHYRDANFRRGPLPGSGRRRYRGCWDRSPRTKHERTANEILRCDEDATEYGIRSRPGRTGYSLPSNWDDIPRERQKSWKAFRKTRWKG